MARETRSYHSAWGWRTVALACGVLLLPLRAWAGDEPASELVSKAKALVAELEYERAVSLSQRVLADSTATLDQRMDAYLYMAQGLAILGREAEAEKAFRFLLRGRPSFDIPSEGTPPKILRVFRNVKVEEDRIRAETAALERQRLMEGLSLTGTPVAKVLGGDPVAFNYYLRDPHGAVGSLKVQYRKKGLGDYAVLPLELGPDGGWSGTIPGVWTENDDGQTVEYGLLAIDRGGESLLAFGVPPDDPMVIHIDPGTIEGRTPFYKKNWFWLASGAAVIGGGVALFFVHESQTRLPSSDLGSLKLP